jgi:hypothetical protein
MKRRAHGLAALASALALFALPGEGDAAAQLFKCIEGGRTVYQQQACPVSAQAEPVASAAGTMARADAASVPAPAANARKLRPASQPASSVPATPR